ncbi:MAG: hypothetical protein H6R05_576 [Burkholderiaceae bacterium]|nr:hypothetical protein [Burkholderiaceae bacterium]
MDAELKKGLIDGVYDAFAFVVGGCVGLLVSQMLGFDLFAQGYTTSSMAAIVLVGLGAGLGLRLVRKYRSYSQRKL